MLKLAAPLLATVAFACAPKRYLSSSEVPKLTKLEQVMDVQATYADPQFKKIGAGAYGDQDFAASADCADRIQATSLKIKDFSKGAEFDALAMKLRDVAMTLFQAAQAKQAKESSAALAEMKASCKE